MLRTLRRLLLGPDPAPAKTPAPAPRQPRSVQSSTRRLSSPPQPQAGNYYEALRPSSDRTPMVSGLPGFRYAGVANGLNRLSLAGVARALYDNGGFPAYAVNQIALCSAPVIPQAATEDKGWNNEAEAVWNDWAKRCDFLGRPGIDVSAIQMLLSQGIDLDGDIGLAVTTDAGFPQVQIVEGWRIGTTITSEKNIHDGVRLDQFGRVVAYLIERDAPKPIEVPASEMILVRDPCLVSPYRGVSPMRRGMNDVRDMRDILGFEKIAVKTNSGLVGVLEGAGLEEDERPSFDLGTGQPPSGLPGEEPQTSDAEIPDGDSPGQETLTRADLLGGDVPVIPEGKEFKRIESNRPNAQFGEFLDTLVAQFAAGLDIPPAFFLDLRNTGPNQRSVIAKAQRKFNQRQDAICRAVEWLWVRVIGWAIDTGQLRAVDGWWKVTFQRPAKLTIDAGREAQQEREDQSRSLMTRQDHFGGRGKDWQRETDQAFAEDRYVIDAAKAMSTATGIPVATILLRYGFGNPNSAPPQELAAEDDQKKRSN